MAFEKLPVGEQEIILQCMKAIASGNEIEDGEFFARLGITRSVLQEITLDWPNVHDSSEDSERFLAINNCLNEVCNGLDIADGKWSDYFAVPKEEINRRYLKWQELMASSHGGIR